MRHLAREIAMKIAFAKLLGGKATFDEALEISYSENENYESMKNSVLPVDVEFAEALVCGVNAHIQELDENIDSYLKDWSLETISKVELTILRIAFYEIMFTNEPSGAIINEAVTLAKEYCDEKKYSYINGVLGAFVKDRNNA